MANMTEIRKNASLTKKNQKNYQNENPCVGFDTVAYRPCSQTIYRLVTTAKAKIVFLY